MSGNGIELEDYLRTASAAPLLTREEELVLSRQAVDSHDAAEKLHQSQMRLVVSIARGYEDSGVSLANLVQAGDEGLRKAITAFDPEADTRLSTWVTSSIRQAIARRIDSTE